MLSEVISFGLQGITGTRVKIETDIYNGMPAFEMVGLPDAAVKESKERVRSAIQNSGFTYPVKRITVNLAPADLKKEGPVYDLPIAVGLLTASEQIKQDFLRYMVMVGELSLTGEVRGVCGVLPIIIEARKLGYKYIVIPYENKEEAKFVADIKVIAVKNLKELAQILNGEKKPYIVPKEKIKYGDNKIFGIPDFADIKGQQQPKRAAQIAAAGGHNLLLIGSPGTGKSMLAKALPGILPDLTFEEALEVTKIHSVAGELKSGHGGIITKRPFRSPHHTSTAAAILGGGIKIQPGEISLAHRGILFLDELPEFQRDIREALRQPMEDKKVSIARANQKVTYPADFMLVASMNPCPCGYYGDGNGKCRCSQNQISNYLNKISGPFLDRIDLHVEVGRVKYDELVSDEKCKTSGQIKEEVAAARQMQLERYKDIGYFYNAQLNSAEIKNYGRITKEAFDFLKAVYEKMGLSARAYGRLLLVARSIADISQCADVKKEHIAEAVRYRSLDRKYWGNLYV